MRALVLVLMLAACGQLAQPEATPEAEVAATSGLDLSGHVIAVGAAFRLDAMPDQNVVALMFPNEQQNVSAPYAAPQATETGAVLHSGDITLTLTPGACAHEGAIYPMHARVAVANGRSAEGCALVRWDRHLVELMPQIDACIAAAPADMSWVSYAGRTGDDVIVRLQGNQAPLHCVVRDGAATVSPVGEDQRIAGDRETLFMRGSGGQNPGGECYQAPEVHSANGEMLGWMLDPLGC
jgi:hypothetical protein